MSDALTRQYRKPSGDLLSNRQCGSSTVRPEQVEINGAKHAATVSHICTLSEGHQGQGVGHCRCECGWQWVQFKARH